jgi:hypothetical protein
MQRVDRILRALRSRGSSRLLRPHRCRYDQAGLPRAGRFACPGERHGLHVFGIKQNTALFCPGNYETHFTNSLEHFYRGRRLPPFCARGDCSEKSFFACVARSLPGVPLPTVCPNLIPCDNCDANLEIGSYVISKELCDDTQFGEAILKAKKVRVCAYCGPTEEKTTRDHVVPQAFWSGRSLPLRTITVPACQGCQVEWDQDATYFRNLIVMGSDLGDHPAVEELAAGAVRRSAERRNNYEDLTKNAMRGFFQPGSNGLYQDLTRIDVNETRLLRTPKKIVRGFFFYRSQKPVPGIYDAGIYPGSGFWKEEWFKEIEPWLTPWESMGDDIFQLRSGRSAEDHNITFWLMQFYRSQAMLGYTWPRRIESDLASLAPTN